MSLATRLSAFFLIALALVLVGFSGASVRPRADLPRSGSSTSGWKVPWTRSRPR